MKKIVLSLTLAFVLLLSISVSDLNTAKANPVWEEMNVPKEPFNDPPIIQIISPNQNQTFTSSGVLLNFNVEIPTSWVFLIFQYNPPLRLTFGNITSVCYSLDDNQPQNLTVDTVSIPLEGDLSQNLNFSVPLNLSTGVHTFRIFVSGFTYYVSNPWVYNPPLASVPVEANTTVSFNVVSPTPIISSPQKIVYNESTVPLQFNLDSSASWIGYSLDDKANVTVIGNTTLSGLPNGEHNVTVYSNDSLGNEYSSQAVNFTVALPTEPYSTWDIFAVLGALVIVAIVIVGVVVYLKKSRIEPKAV
ncbi:MAG: hypothetical protein ABSB10_03150 [Candidatus Bathyarchaeia archaeon]|jgi:hypothetical protein